MPILVPERPTSSENGSAVGLASKANACVTRFRRYWTVTDAQAAASVVLVHHDANIETSEESMAS
jgi:hypothetical protein